MNDTPLVYSFNFQDKVTSMELRIRKIVFMWRHSSALLLSMMHKKIVISAFLMHIDVSINWRKSIHKNNFFLLKLQKKCPNNRVFPTGREWGELPLPTENSLIPPPGKSPQYTPPPPPPNFYSLPIKSASLPH